MSTDKKFTVRPEIVVNLTEQDIRDIVITALEGGISYWACLDNTGATHDGTPISEQATDVLLTGGSLTFTDAEGDPDAPGAESWTLTLSKLLNGIKLYFEEGCHVKVEDNAIDTCDVDANDADCIVQFAIFGEVVFA